MQLAHQDDINPLAIYKERPAQHAFRFEAQA